MELRKIEAMHHLYGKVDSVNPQTGKPLRCGDCPHYVSDRYHDKILRKCEAYGMTHSEASDWAKSKPACGLIAMEELPDDWVDVIKRKPVIGGGKLVEVIPGQVMMEEFV